jgi:hypothetical protein
MKPAWIKKIMVMFVIALVAAAAWGWKVGIPLFIDLKDKSPVQFQAMVDAAKGFHLIQAGQLLQELRHLSFDEARALRYRTWKENFASDEGFRSQEREALVLGREESRATRTQNHQNEIQKLVKPERFQTQKKVSTVWEGGEPWERSLALREKCREYLKRERVKKPGLKKSVLSKKQSLEISQLCESWVPVSHSLEEVEKTLETLKHKMNYFYFVQLLEDLGLSEKEPFSLPDRLERMTAGLPDH